MQTGAHTSLFLLYVYWMGAQFECFVTGSGPVPYLCYHACALLSRVQLFATPWTVALQAPLSMGMDGDRNTGVACHFLLQETYPAQESNLSLLHWQVDSLPLAPPLVLVI